MVDAEAIRAKAREIDEAEAEAKRFHASVGERFFIVREGTDKNPGERIYEPASRSELIAEVEAGRALDGLIETRKAEFDALVNGRKAKRRRAKKVDGAEKVRPTKGGLGRRGLPKAAPDVDAKEA